MNILYKFVSIILVTIFLTGCGKGQPTCSDKDVVEILDGLLSDQAKFLALSGPALGNVGYSQDLLKINPKANKAAKEGNAGEAFDLIEATVNATLDMAPIYKLAVNKAKESTFALSGIKTEKETEHRTSCSASVQYTLGFPSAEFVGEPTYRTLSLISSFKMDITYDAYFSDDGTLYVELDR